MRTNEIMNKTLNIKIVALLLFVILSSFVGQHKYYVSVTEIEYVPEEETVQIISRLFIDDFEVILQERYDSNFHLENENTKAIRLKYIQKYYDQKILISINEKPQNITLLGVKFEGDMLISYLEITAVKHINQFEILNTLLLENGNNQQNITHIDINNKKKSYLFIKGKASEKIKF